MHDTTEPDGGHRSGRFNEWQRDPVERNDPQSGGKQPWRAATSGSREHRAHQGWDTFQHSTRETLDQWRISDAVEGSGVGVEGDQFSGLDQFDRRR